MVDIVCGCVSTWTCLNRGKPAPDRLRSLGRHLADIGSSSLGDFEHLLRVVLWRQASFQVAQQESAIRKHGGCPAFWASEVQRDIEAIQAAVTKPGYVLPIDLLPQHQPEQEILAQTQDLVRRYGELLSWWPDIIERARALAASERLPAVPI
jgi:hypothetical protein